MRARDKRTATESFKCRYFVVMWKTQKNLRRGWQPKAPLPLLVRSRVNIPAASSDVNIQGRHWQPLSVHLWANCNPPIAQGNNVWCQLHRGNLTYSFWTVMWVSIWLMKEEQRRMKETRPTAYSHQWRDQSDHLNCDNVTASMISPVIRELGDQSIEISHPLSPLTLSCNEVWFFFGSGWFPA